MSQEMQTKILAMDLSAPAEAFALLIVATSFAISFFLLLYFLFARFRAYFPFIGKLLRGNASRGDLDGAIAEHRLNSNASYEMLGSRNATLFGRLLIIGVGLVFMYLAGSYPGIGTVLLIYVGFGYWYFRKLGYEINDPNKRLLVEDRLSFIFLHSVLWPWHMLHTERKILRTLALKLIFRVLMKTSILRFLGFKPPYKLRDFQKRKAALKVIYLFGFGLPCILPVFSVFLLDAHLGAAHKLVIYCLFAVALFVLSLNAIFGDHFFLGNIIVKVINHNSFELHDSFQATNPRKLYKHAKRAVNKLFRNGADRVVINSHVFGDLTSVQVDRLGDLLRRRCIGAGCGFIGDPMPIGTFGLLIAWIFGIQFRSRYRRELVLLKSTDEFKPNKNFVRLF